MAIDFESLRDSVIVAAQSGVEKVRELAGTGAAKAKELTDTGVTKAKELSEISKLKVQNSVEQDAIRKAYSELGKLYYAENGAEPTEPYAELCQQITDSLAKISYNNERIADIKAAGAAESDVEDEEIEEVPVEEPCCCASEEPAPCCCCGSEEPAEEAPVEEPKVEE